LDVERRSTPDGVRNEQTGELIEGRVVGWRGDKAVLLGSVLSADACVTALSEGDWRGVDDPHHATGLAAGFRL